MWPTGYFIHDYDVWLYTCIKKVISVPVNAAWHLRQRNLTDSCFTNFLYNKNRNTITLVHGPVNVDSSAYYMAVTDNSDNVILKLRTAF